MDLVGFLRFSLLCLDFLAWPTFALGYPILASIRAIETDSKYHMKKLVTYWTIFSLISLLEHTFKLIQWLPFWPYIKLIAICWLVIPHFNGASHVYQGLVHPCLSLNLRNVINWPQDNATFLTSVETYLKENKSEALEKLITSKGKHNEHHVTDAQKDMERVELTDKNVVAEEPQLSSLKNADVREDIQRVEPTDQNTAAEGQSVKHPLENLSNAKNKTTTAAQVPKLSMPTVVEEKRPSEIPAVKKAQREWTCAVCQLTTKSEADLNSHLMGKRHKTKSEELKTSKQTAKNVQSSSSRATDLMQLSGLNNADAQEDIQRGKPRDKYTAAEGQLVKHPLENLANTENKTTSAAQVSKLSMPTVVEEKRPLEIPAVKEVQREWTSAVCQLTTTSEANLNSHLMGKRHKTNSEELKTGKQTAKNVQSSTSRATDLMQLSSLKNADAGEDIQRVEPTDKNTAAEGQSVKHPLENLANTENKTTSAAQVPKLSMPRVVEEKIPLEIPAVKKVQREWTCAVCQLTATSEANLNSHLMGKRHKTKSEELKTGKQTAKNVQSSTSKATDLMQLSSLKNADAAEDIQRVETTDKSTAAEGQSVKHPVENLSNSENKTTTAARVPKLSMPTVIEEKTPLEIPAVKKVQREWTCAVCQVTTTSEATLNLHLKGKRHGKQTANNVESSTLRATDSNHEHKKHKNCLPGEKSEQNPTEKQENVHYSAATVEDTQKKPYNAGNLIQHSNLWCSICNIRCTGEIDMAVHLNGRKHLYKVQSLLNSVSGEQA